MSRSRRPPRSPATPTTRRTSARAPSCGESSLATGSRSLRPAVAVAWVATATRAGEATRGGTNLPASVEDGSPSLFEEDAPPDELLAGRRALEGLDGVALLEDYRWYELPDDVGVWVLRCRLSPP